MKNNLELQEIGGCQQGRISGSALIAEFMGVKKEDTFAGKRYCYNGKYSVDLFFSSSWEWLMPVVEKICKTKIGDGTDTIDYTYLRTFGMLNEEDGDQMVRFNCFGLHQSKRLIDATFDAVVEVLQSIPKADR